MIAGTDTRAAFPLANRFFGIQKTTVCCDAPSGRFAGRIVIVYSQFIQTNRPPVSQIQSDASDGGL